MSKFLGFLLGIAVALVGPAVFGVLAADGGIKLNAKEMALAYGIGALIFWAVVSYFSGAAALGAALTFGAMIYTVHWIPNRMTNFLNDVPGVTTGMIDGIKQYTANGVVPILAVISLVFGIQSIVRSVQRRRRERAEADRRQREQEAAVQAQQMPEPVAAYPVAGGDYQQDDRFGNNFGNSNYDDLFEEEPTPFTPRNQADEQTAQFSPATAPKSYEDDDRDETRLVPTDADETAMVPTGERTVAGGYDGADTPEEAATEQASVEEQVAPEADEAPDEVETQAVSTDEAAAQQVAVEEAATQQVVVDEPRASQAEEAGTQPVPVPEPEAPKAVAPRVAGGGASEVEDGGEATQPMPIARPEAARNSEAALSAETQARELRRPQAEASQAPGSQGQPSQAEASQAPAAQGQPSQAEASQAPVSQGQPSQAEASQAPASQGQPSQAEAPRAQAPQAQAQAPQAEGARGGGLRKEEMGQQYRERMDPPDVDDTGEFFVGAFETPPEPMTQRMELPGQFRS